MKPPGVWLATVPLVCSRCGPISVDFQQAPCDTIGPDFHPIGGSRRHLLNAPLSRQFALGQERTGLAKIIGNPQLIDHVRSLDRRLQHQLALGIQLGSSALATGWKETPNIVRHQQHSRYNDEHKHTW